MDIFRCNTQKDEGIQEGDLVYVYDSSDVQLGFGQYHNASIAVRILSFGPGEFVPTFGIQNLKLRFICVNPLD